MSRHTEARFEIASWDEAPFEGGDDATKLTEALVTKRYEGDIEGTSTTKWLLAYAPDKSALFVGVEYITGTIGGKKGSLVLLHPPFLRRRPGRLRPGGSRSRFCGRRSRPLPGQSGRFCCSMYCLMMVRGAPPQEAAK